MQNKAMLGELYTFTFCVWECNFSMSLWSSWLSSFSLCTSWSGASNYCYPQSYWRKQGIMYINGFARIKLVPLWILPKGFAGLTTLMAGKACFCPKSISIVSLEAAEQNSRFFRIGLDVILQNTIHHYPLMYSECCACLCVAVVFLFIYYVLCGRGNAGTFQHISCMSVCFLYILCMGCVFCGMPHRESLFQKVRKLFIGIVNMFGGEMPILKHVSPSFFMINRYTASRALKSVRTWYFEMVLTMPLNHHVNLRYTSCWVHYNVPFQESSESANTTIEDEDVKGMVNYTHFTLLVSSVDFHVFILLAHASDHSI